jgi:hypothetical protein
MRSVRAAVLLVGPLAVLLAACPPEVVRQPTQLVADPLK